jgi:hypothetical protein
VVIVVWIIAETPESVSANPIERNGAMKLNSAQVEQTLSQFEAQAIPEDHPVVPRLCELFGDHTFFLNSSGLNVIEPSLNESTDGGSQAGTVVNLADWSDADRTSLAPHNPEPTEINVKLEPAD